MSARDDVLQKLGAMPRVDATAFASTTPPPIRLVIVGEITPSLNVLLRMHFGERKRRARDWAARILYAVRCAGLDKETIRATGKRRLTIERHGRALLDADNLAGGAKDLTDEVKKFGLIRDDRPDLCELMFRQEKLLPKHKPHMVIILEDLP